MTNRKKAVIASTALLLAVSLGSYVSIDRSARETDTEAGPQSSVSEARGGDDMGTVASIDRVSITISLSDGREKAYSLSSSTVAFKIAIVPLEKLESGDVVSVITNPVTKDVVSIWVGESGVVPAVRDSDDWFFVGNATLVSGRDLTLRDEGGVERTFTLGEGIVATKVDRIDVSMLERGDKARVAWHELDGSSPVAGGIYVTVE
ncbi:MAG: hypothetical protein HZA81_03450 [Candidatus Taylorbacteria bacterium]|nr:hypothetical protein [Candidatus Taylorbacteria bacterium]